MIRHATLLATALALLPAALAAQASPPVWREVMRGDDGTTVSIDSAHVSSTSRAGFIVRTAVRFPQPMQLESGATIDREVDLEELECDSTRIRGVESRLLSDTVVVRRVLLSRAWQPVEESRRPLFDVRCAWLVGSFGIDSGPENDSTVDVAQPEIANRSEVARELSQVRPSELLQPGQTGTVTVRMRVLEDGTVDDPTITILDATPGFAEGAVRAVQRMRFRPARVEGRPVKIWVRLPVTYTVQAPPVPVNPPSRRP